MTRNLLKVIGFSLLLGGCASSPSSEVVLSSPIDGDSKVEEKTVSLTCADSLFSQRDELSLHQFQAAFEACNVPISNEQIVSRYIEALVRTGQFKALKSDTWRVHLTAEQQTLWQSRLEVM